MCNAKKECSLDELLDILPDPAFAIDMDKRVIAWNSAAEALTKVHKADIIGTSNYSIAFYGEARQILIDSMFGELSDDAIGKYLQYKTDGNGNHWGTAVVKHMKRPDGHQTVLWGYAAKLVDGDGKQYGAIESVRDITDAYYIEKKLTTIFSKYVGPAIIYGSDKVITECNACFAELVGMPIDEIRNVTKWDQFFAPECLDMMLKNHALRTATPDDPGIKNNYEAIILRPDESRREVLVSVGMVHDSEERVATLLDITNHNRRKKFEGQIRKYFDPTVLKAIEGDRSLLSISSKTVTIVFWDIRGFSKLCESLKAHPRLISEFLKDYCELCAKAIFQRGGVLDKFIGDGVMAIFGFIDDGKDAIGRQAAITAVITAMDILPLFNEHVAVLKQKWRLFIPNEIEIGLGCGIHTGEVLIGEVGTDLRDQFTALGPHVNLASRIEARAAANQILISTATAARVDGEFTCRLAHTVSDIKNIVGTYKLYEVVMPPNDS